MMKNEYRWSLIKEAGRSHYRLKVQFRDGRTVRISTGESTKKLANKKVPELLTEALEKIGVKGSDWDQFVALRKDSMRRLTKQHQNDWALVSFEFEAAVSPTSVADINVHNLEKFVKHLEAKELTPIRINGYLSLIRSAVNYAHEKGLIATKPPIKLLSIPKVDAAHGRALTSKEIQIYLKAVPLVMGETFKDQWTFLVKGLLYSGFRIDEAYRFTWDDRTSISIDDIDSRHPKFVFPTGTHKSKRRLIVPMIPEMVELLRTVKPKFRKGRVFQPVGVKGKIYACSKTVSKRLSKIGEKAKIVVETNEKTGKPVYASAHDFRRTFADLVLDRYQNPTVVQQLMRHAEFSTTQRHYAIKQIDRLAEIVHGIEVSGLGPTMGPTVAIQNEELEKTPIF